MLVCVGENKEKENGLCTCYIFPKLGEMWHKPEKLLQKLMFF